MSEPLEHPHGQEGEEEGEEEWESEDSWESDLDSEAEIAELMQMDDLVDDSASTGKQEYLAKCSELRIVPVAMFIAKLECEHINLRHHGMGVKGARALAAALLANSKIRSLNLGDNWFGDEGVLAVAEVACLPALRATARPPRPALQKPLPSLLPPRCAPATARLDDLVWQVLASNSAITSLDLSDNHIGLPGVKELCRQMQARRLASPAAAPPTRKHSGPPAGRPRARENATLAQHTHVVCVWHVHVTWRCSQVNSTLAEISLKGNRLDDRAATPLCEVCSVGTTSRRRGRSSAVRAPSLA